MSSSNTPVSSRTLRRWLHSYESGQPVRLAHGVRGRPRVLSPEQERLLIGHVIFETEHGRLSTLGTMQAWAKEHLGADIAPTTIRNHIQENGLIRRLVKQRKANSTTVTDDLVRVAYDFVKSLPVGLDPSRVCSVDFTYTSHRTCRPATWAPRGSQKPSKISKAPRHTQCIVTCVWADGVNRTPALAYTYNPEFSTDRKDTPRRVDLKEALAKALEEEGLEDDRVVYLDCGKGRRGVYVPESSELVRDFFEFYKVGSGIVVFSDAGRAFKEGQEDVFEKLGFKKHYTYPPDVHHYLSPNDNGVHGPAKAAWRKKCQEESGDVRTTLHLLKQLDVFSLKGGKYFDRCMPQVRGERLHAAMRALVRGGVKDSYRKFDRAQWEYRVFMGLPGKEDKPALPRHLDDSLDGFYYT